MCDEIININGAGSHPARGAWIEMTIHPAFGDKHKESHPARGAWIEISRRKRSICLETVAPRKGCVD